MILPSSTRPPSALLPMFSGHHRSQIIVFIAPQSISSLGQLAQCQCGQVESSQVLSLLQSNSSGHPSFSDMGSAPLGWPAIGDLIPATADILTIVSHGTNEMGYFSNIMLRAPAASAWLLMLPPRTMGSSGRYSVWVAKGNWGKLPQLGQEFCSEKIHTCISLQGSLVDSHFPW